MRPSSLQIIALIILAQLTLMDGFPSAISYQKTSKERRILRSVRNHQNIHAVRTNEITQPNSPTKTLTSSAPVISHNSSSLEEESSRGLGRSLEHSPALVLNADYQPLSFMPLSLWAWQDAMRAVLSEKADVICEYEDLCIRSVSFTMKLPSVIVLRNYFHHQNFVPFVTQKYVFLRDDYACQYCGKRFPTTKLSIDHVVPRKSGGKTSWNNVVTACCPCNQRKGCLSVSELHTVGMRLRKPPHIPTMNELQMKCRQYRRPFLHNPDDVSRQSDEQSTTQTTSRESLRTSWETATMSRFRCHPHWLQFLS